MLGGWQLLAGHHLFCFGPLSREPTPPSHLPTLAQVLPPDVDYKVMLTFLEFYSTLLQVGAAWVGGGVGEGSRVHPQQPDCSLAADQLQLLHW